MPDREVYAGNSRATPPDGVANEPSRHRMQTQERSGIMFRN
jgi:hypothetical protein